MYTSADEAKSLGLTHYGSYFGIPLYIGEVDGECAVELKYSFMYPLMELFHHIEGVINELKGVEPNFQFTVKGEL